MDFRRGDRWGGYAVREEGKLFLSASRGFVAIGLDIPYPSGDALLLFLGQEKGVSLPLEMADLKMVDAANTPYVKEDREVFLPEIEKHLPTVNRWLRQRRNRKIKKK